MVRMWMVSPSVLCRKHLLGEHNELHKIVGSLRKQRSITGYIKNNCVEVKKIEERHNDLVKEMRKRNYTHKSPLPLFDYSYLPKEQQDFKINLFQNRMLLLNRCDKCFKINVLRAI